MTRTSTLRKGGAEAQILLGATELAQSFTSSKGATWHCKYGQIDAKVSLEDLLIQGKCAPGERGYSCGSRGVRNKRPHRLGTDEPRVAHSRRWLRFTSSHRIVNRTATALLTVSIGTFTP
jgi:hypothetical protein